ncbi:MAG: hypothetical protein LQ340_004804 [Diploschistes diacapsis]|nr:MAG: hypothetical protein LQ340_004804 [Diploschistes diacapsis]
MLRGYVTTIRCNSVNLLSSSYKARCFNSRGLTGDDVSSDEQEAARTWLDNHNRQGIPRRLCNVTFSRSSGPGGQHVNKTNSKATLKLKLADLSPIPPRLIYEQLCNSRYSAGKGEALIIQVDASRAQSDNKEECFSKLDRLIRDVCERVVVTQTSPAQLAKVKNLQKAEKERRLSMKKKQSAKKSSRRSSVD